jgi:hypothetical protein
MAEQWYYAQQGQRQGPVDEEQLKQLAASGQLKPRDLIWKKGMAAWQAASAVEGLVPKPSEPEPPPIPLQDSPLPPIPPKDFLPPPEPRNSAGSKVGKLIASLAKRGKAAAQLVAMQAMRTKLLNVNLPTAYQALGKHIHGTGNYRDEFPELFKKLDDTLAAIAALNTHSAAAPKAEGFAAKAKAAANATSDMAHSQVLKLKANHSFAELGKAVFAKHGDESGFEEVVRPVLDCRTRLEKLDSEIKGLSQSGPGRIITAKRLAIGGIFVAGVVILLVACNMFWGDGPRNAKANGPSNEDLARAKEGDKLWDQGEKAEAIARYTGFLSSSLSDRNATLDKDTYYTRILARTVEYLVEQDDISTARDLLKKAVAGEGKKEHNDDGTFVENPVLVLPLTSKKAKTLLSDVRAEHEKERQQADAEWDKESRNEEPKESRKNSSGSNYYGQPRVDETGRWISGEEAYRRQVEKDADAIRSQMRKGDWEK